MILCICQKQFVLVLIITNVCTNCFTIFIFLLFPKCSSEVSYGYFHFTGRELRLGESDLLKASQSPSPKVGIIEFVFTVYYRGYCLLHLTLFYMLYNNNRNKYGPARRDLQSNTENTVSQKSKSSPHFTGPPSLDLF